MKAPQGWDWRAKNKIIIHRSWVSFYKVTLYNMVGNDWDLNPWIGP